ncbi:unnamed protein product [Urochloa humidicola]
MSRRMRPGGALWSKLRPAVRARVPGGNLSREEGHQICAELIPGPYHPPPGVPGAENAPGRRNSGRRSALELGRMIGERYRSRDLGPEEALHLFDELLLQATPASIYALNQLLTVVANAPASSSLCDGPARAISLFNRMARAGASKVAPDICTYNILIGCCGHGPLGPWLCRLGPCYDDRMEGEFYHLHAPAQCPLCGQEDRRCHGHSEPRNARAWLHAQCLLLQPFYSKGSATRRGVKRLSICSTSWLEMQAKTTVDLMWCHIPPSLMDS